MDIPLSEIRRVLQHTRQSRFPVYGEHRDNIIGILHTPDLLGVEPDQPISEYIRPALYVPASKSVKELMPDLRKEGTVVAIVVDEFGGAEGIVTME